MTFYYFPITTYSLSSINRGCTRDLREIPGLTNLSFIRVYLPVDKKLHHRLPYRLPLFHSRQSYCGMHGWQRPCSMPARQRGKIRKSGFRINCQNKNTMKRIMRTTRRVVTRNKRKRTVTLRACQKVLAYQRGSEVGILYEEEPTKTLR